MTGGGLSAYEKKLRQELIETRGLPMRGVGQELIESSGRGLGGDLPMWGVGGETHLPLLVKPGSSPVVANFLGPGTRIVDRVRRDDPALTYADSAAMAHDIRVALNRNNPRKLREADLKFLETLETAEAKQLDNAFNTQPAKAMIEAKMKMEDAGLMKPGKFTAPEPMTAEDEGVLKNKLSILEQTGLGEEKNVSINLLKDTQSRLGGEGKKPCCDSCKDGGSCEGSENDEKEMEGEGLNLAHENEQGGKGACCGSCENGGSCEGSEDDSDDEDMDGTGSWEDAQAEIERINKEKAAKAGVCPLAGSGLFSEIRNKVSKQVVSDAKDYLLDLNGGAVARRMGAKRPFVSWVQRNFPQTSEQIEGTAKALTDRIRNKVGEVPRELDTYLADSMRVALDSSGVMADESKGGGLYLAGKRLINGAGLYSAGARRPGPYMSGGGNLKKKIAKQKLKTELVALKGETQANRQDNARARREGIIQTGKDLYDAANAVGDLAERGIDIYEQTQNV